MDAACAAAIGAAGLLAGAGAPMILVAVLGASGVGGAMYAWNDIGIGGRVEGNSLVASTLAGTRRIDVGRATRVEAFRMTFSGGSRHVRVVGPDGALTVWDRVPGALGLIRAAVLSRGKEIAVTAKAARALGVSLTGANQARGGRFLLTNVAMGTLLAVSVFVGTALFSPA